MAPLKVFGIVYFAFILTLSQGIPTEQDDCGRCVDKFNLLQGYANDNLFESNSLDLLGFCDHAPFDVQQVCRELASSFGKDTRLKFDTQQMKALCRAIGECKPKQPVTDNVDVIIPFGEYQLNDIVLDSELDGSICSICRMVTSSIHNLLVDPHIQSVILRILQGACKFIPFFKGECENLIKHYGHSAINFLADWLTPQVCELFHLCSRENFRGTNVESCKMCQFGVGLIHDTLHDPAIDERIGLVFDDLCQNFGASETTCKEVKAYVLEQIPELIKTIRHDLNLEEICKSSDVCKQEKEDTVVFEESEDGIGNDDLNSSEESDSLYFEADGLPRMPKVY